MAPDADYDVIVIGVGGHGSAALYHLAQRGLKVLGIEQFSVAHDKGSSHGLSRIIRLQYHEHPDYVPLLKRAYELWDALEKKTGKKLLHMTGCLELADPAVDPDNCFTNALHSCIEHSLEHEVLSADEVNTRFPGYHVPPKFQALYQPQGGILASERCIAAHVEAALCEGAVMHTEERMCSWRVLQSGLVEVRTDKGTYQAAKVVLTAGAWMPQLVPQLQTLAAVQRQVVGWFDTSEPSSFGTDTFPVWILEDKDLGYFYGFPEFDGQPGMKLGKFYHLNEAAVPEQLSRAITAADEEVSEGRPQALRGCVRKFFPKADGAMIHAVACMFTNSTDSHFLIDAHPCHPEVILCSACSGHGFKFTSVIGEVLADLVVHGDTRHAIGLHRFSPDRPGHRAFLGACMPSSL